MGERILTTHPLDELLEAGVVDPRVPLPLPLELRLRQQRAAGVGVLRHKLELAWPFGRWWWLID